MSKLKPVKIVLSKIPAVYLVFMAGLVLMTASLVLTYHHRSFVSDDVTWQNIIRTWHPFSGQHVTLGATDNFIDKLPFFALMEHFFHAGRKLLFLESYILATISFTIFYASVVYFLRRAKIERTFRSLLPLLWFSSFGYSFSELFLNPIWRGFELGISFGFFALLAAVFYQDIKPYSTWRGRLLSMLLAILVGVIIYSDPYFLYFAVGPILLLTVGLWLIKLIRTSQLLFTFVFMFIAFVFDKLTALVSSAAGISMAAAFPTQFVAFDRLPTNFWGALHGFLVIFGADFFGIKIASPGAITALLNICLLGFVLVASYRTIRKAIIERHIKESLVWPLFFALLIPFVFFVSVFSTFTDVSTYRYFAMAVYGAIILLCLATNSIRGSLRIGLTAILIIATVCNLLVAARGNAGIIQPSNIGNPHNSLNYSLIHEAAARHLTKGYGNYWDAPINSYLSRGTLTVLPAACGQGRTVKFHWLLDETTFSLPATSSFYLIDPNIVDPPTCSQEQLIQQFGEPTETFAVGDKLVLVYDYDIGSKM